MNREEKIVLLKLDVIFKRVFGNESNKSIIAAFISDLLEIPRESIKAYLYQQCGAYTAEHRTFSAVHAAFR